MDKEKIWLAVLESLKISLSPASFSTWLAQTFIDDIKIIDKEKQIAEIGCPNPFIKNEVENRYYVLIKSTLDQITKKRNDLVFVVRESKRAGDLPAGRQGGRDTLFEKPEEKPEVIEAIRNAGLRDDFNFETFAVSSTNQMAHAAAQAVAKNPGKAYNPLFLYGGVGVGKTHLMQAIAHAVLARLPHYRTVYCTGEEFTNEIVDAIRHKNTNEFKKKYRTTKLFLVDDIQFIAGKEKAQEEFFHTFNAIWRLGGQIVLTSDRPPEEIQKLEARLRSRFEGGLIVDIQEPDFELRTAILLIKAQQWNFKLPMEIAQLIASNITSTRKLEGFLIKLISETETKKSLLTTELVTAILGTANRSSTTHRVVKPKEIISATAAHYDLKINELIGQCRVKKFVVPRQILMYLLRNEINLQYEEIGRLLENRDHTTIMHGVEKITKLLPESEQIRVDMAGIKKRLYD